MFQFNPPSTNLFQTQSTTNKPFSFAFNAVSTQSAQPSTFQFNTPSAAPSFGFPNISQSNVSSFPSLPSLPLQAPQPITAGQLPAASSSASQNNIQQLYLSFSTPAIFNDARDQVLQQWNQLQALVGKGKGYYNPQLPPIDYLPDGIVAKLKTICYNNIVEEKNEDGVMLFISNKPYEEVIKVKTQLADGINRILGNKPNINVEISNIRKLVDNQKCCLTLTVVEKLPQGLSRKASCCDLMSIFSVTSNPSMKSQLESLSIVEVMPKMGPSKEQLEAYLKSPPSNISPKLWQEGISTNPDPTKLIPVPVYGFSGLAQRLNQLKIESNFHQSRREQMKSQLSEQQSGVCQLENKMFQLTRKYKDLRHRLIKVKTRQDVCRFSGVPIQGFEVGLRSQLEAIKHNLDSNEHIQGLWKEIRARKQLMDKRSKSNTSNAKGPTHSAPLDPVFINEYKEFIAREQECLDYLVNTLKNDAKDLEYIQNTFVKTASLNNSFNI